MTKDEDGGGAYDSDTSIGAFFAKYKKKKEKQQKIKKKPGPKPGSGSNQSNNAHYGTGQHYDANVVSSYGHRSDLVYVQWGFVFLFILLASTFLYSVNTRGPQQYDSDYVNDGGGIRPNRRRSRSFYDIAWDWVSSGVGLVIFILIIGLFILYAYKLCYSVYVRLKNSNIIFDDLLKQGSFMSDNLGNKATLEKLKGRQEELKAKSEWWDNFDMYKEYFRLYKERWLESFATKFGVNSPMRQNKAQNRFDSIINDINKLIEKFDANIEELRDQHNRMDII